MSSAVVSTSAAHGRPFLFDASPNPEVGSQSKVLPSSITLASRLKVRPAPEMAPSGIPEIDALTGGLPRGCLTEICGPLSSGRTTVLLSALAAATRRGEFCALIDASDTLDPQSLDAARADLDRLLWVRCSDQPRNANACPERSRRVSPALAGASRPRGDTKQTRTSEHRLEQVLRATDLLLESGGFGLIILDLANVPPQSARRIPLTTWFRFRRAVEHKPTILLAIEHQPIAGSCSSLLLQLAVQQAAAFISPARQCRVASEYDPEFHREGIPALSNETGHTPTHVHLFSGLQITADLIRSRVDRKPSQSITFTTKTAWAG